MTQTERAARFQALHQRAGAFLIPNPWDAGSARILAGLGFEAFATSSGAAAATYGRRESWGRCAVRPGASRSGRRSKGLLSSFEAGELYGRYPRQIVHDSRT